MTSRRRFLQRAMLGLGTIALTRRARCAPESTSTIEILLNEPLGTISPYIYGHFIEHMGTVIYDGVWVGENSKIPHIGGIRRQLIDGLRNIRASIIRWPGGCFADSYDWQDGVGPRSSRPQRANPYSDFMDSRALAGPQRYDPNQFGTHEFVNLCRLTGSDPFLAANLRGLPAQDFQRWMEYCNAPAGTTALAKQRERNGSKEPFNVLFWGIGNEVWGCGGGFTAAEYATEYRRFTEYLPRYGLDVKFIATGAEFSGLADSTGADWIHQFMRRARRPSHPAALYGMSLHFYAGWDTSASEKLFGAVNEAFQAVPEGQSLESLLPDPLHYDANGWYQQLRECAHIESFIEASWAALGEEDPEHRVKIIVDEWDSWNRSGGSELSPLNYEGRAVTLRDAIGSAMTLDIFNRHCDKVAMANRAMLINSGGSLFYAEGDRFVATPVYHVFQMYAAHQGAQCLRTVFNPSPIQYMNGKIPAILPGLSASASRNGHEMTLTVVNAHATEFHELAISIRGAASTGGEVTTLTHANIHARNSFDDPQAVHPVTTDLKQAGSLINYTAPPASVTSIRLKLV